MIGAADRIPMGRQSARFAVGWGMANYVRGGSSEPSFSRATGPGAITLVLLMASVGLSSADRQPR